MSLLENSCCSKAVFARVLDNLEEPLIIILIVSGLISVVIGHHIQGSYTILFHGENFPYY